MKQQNFVLILSSPSGAGKTTISKHLLNMDYKLVPSISVTTRTKRPQEVEAVDYYFVTKEKFKLMQESEELLESAKVFNNYYGSPKQYVMDQLSDGFDVLFDIDWQGAKILKEKLGTRVVSIFILPPSLSELENRLKIRGQDTDEVIKIRMEKAHEEISKYHLYDYVLVNKDFDKTVSRIMSIIRTERLRHIDFSQFVKNLI